MNQTTKTQLKVATETGLLAILSGVALGLVAAVFSMSGSLKDERAISRAYLDLVENSRTAFILVDGTGKVTAWSKGAEELFGVTRNQAVGYDMSAYIPKSMRALHRQKFEQYVASGGSPSVTIVECRAPVKGREPADLIITIRSVVDHNGRMRLLTEATRRETVQKIEAGDLTTLAHAGGE